LQAKLLNLLLISEIHASLRRDVDGLCYGTACVNCCALLELCNASKKWLNSPVLTHAEVLRPSAMLGTILGRWLLSAH
jgi:hypothetical protein